MLFKSQLVTQASGSVGGLTASRNRGGMYLRGRTIPVNPSSSQQQTVRNAMTVLTNTWGDVLTQTQRDGWGVYGEQVPLTNALGDQVTASGISHYIRSNVPRLQAGLARVDTPPGIFNLGDFTEPSLAAASVATQEAAVLFDDGDAWANENDSAMIVFLSRPQNVTINYFKGPYRLAGIIAGNGTTAPASPASFTLPFPIIAGQKLFMKVRVSRADGRLSGEFRDDVLTVA